MAVVMATGSNKRKRPSAEEGSPPDRRLRLADLPDALLAGAASYLPRMPCLSFAAATATAEIIGPADEPTATSRAIAATQSWGALDLGDVQEYIRRRLTDDDVRWILVCIDAVNNVESLKLTSCLGIVGSGLEPLRGSTALERIDLSLVGRHESPIISPEPPISADVVLPILDSIVGSEGSSLVHVQLPRKWLAERGGALHNFLESHVRALNARRIQCSGEECDRTCDEYHLSSSRVGWVSGWQLGVVRDACYQCLKQFCTGCTVNDLPLQFCKCCERNYCDDCAVVEECHGLHCRLRVSSCAECGLVKRDRKSVV